MILCATGFLENVSEVLLTVKYKQLSPKERVVGLEFDEVCQSSFTSGILSCNTQIISDFQC